MHDYEQAQHIVVKLHRLRGVMIEGPMLIALSSLSDRHQDAAASDAFARDLESAVTEASEHVKLLRYGDPERGIERTVCQRITSAEGFDPGILEGLEDFCQQVKSLQISVGNAEGKSNTASADLIKLCLSLPDRRIAVGHLINHIEELAEKWREEAARNDNLVATVDGALGEIADLTRAINMVAINAGIEASRAGEHGAGFRVLAGEMHRLSDRAAHTLTLARATIGT